MKLLQLRGQADAAVQLAERGLSLSEAAGDRDLILQFHLQRARAFLTLGRPDQAEQALRRAADYTDGASVIVTAEVDSLFAKVLASRNRLAEAAAHYERALRVLSIVGGTGLRAQMISDCAHAIAGQAAFPGPMLAPSVALPGSVPEPATLPGLGAGARPGSELDSTAHSRPGPNVPTVGPDHLPALASVIDFVDHPELLGHELMSLLLSAGCAGPMALVSRRGGAREIVAHTGCAYADAADLAAPASQARRLTLGSAAGRELELVVTAPPELAAEARLRAIEKILQAALALQRERRERREHAAPAHAAPVIETGAGLFASAAMLQILSLARRASTSTVGILISGETGSGKEVLARAIHESSPRASRPFIPFNCLAVPRDMLDSQLFGYRRGAFTGAGEAFPGVIRAAAGGTLFLDEIGELPLELQPKFLRFLDTWEVHPLGETAPVRVDVRVIAATNVNLEDLVRAGRFREDLYYRLNILRLTIPPLRERRDEIPALAHYFLRRAADELQRPGVALADETLEYLLLYHWPGNVRQLANEIRRMVTLAEPGALLEPEHLDPAITTGRRGRTAPGRDGAAPAPELVVRLDQPLPSVVEQVERVMIQGALTGGRSLDDAARTLGLSRKGLYLKRRRLGI